MPQPLPSSGDEVYLRTHARRYALLLELVRELAPRTTLVVGPSYESVMLRDAVAAGKVDTLGWADHRFPRMDGERHLQHDLNDPNFPEFGPYQAIVCAEVIEHLHIPAETVLRALAAGLEERGHLLLQTPNATALPKRLRMLLGRNPYEPLRAEPGNPGHFHEYTVAELRRAVGATGFALERLITANYFNHGSRKNAAYRAVDRVLPATLREGITIVARRP